MAIADARHEIDNIHWFVPQYAHSIAQQSILSKQILIKLLTELRYIERSVLMKKVNNQILLYFKLGSKESTNVPIWITAGFQQRNRQDSQDLNFDRF